MVRIDRALLEKPFRPDVIKVRRGPHGRELSYVEAPQYIQRLNEAFGSEWSWKIVAYEQHGSEIVVQGALEAGGQTKHAFGGSTVTVDRSGLVVSLADDMKAAATDALKKACSLFGIAIELYGATPPTVTAPAPNRTRLQVVQPTDTDGDTRTLDRTPPQAPERLTAKQLKYLYAIAHRDGITDARLKEIAVEKFGVTPQYLNRRDASAFIEQLEAGDV